MKQIIFCAAMFLSLFSCNKENSHDKSLIAHFQLNGNADDISYNKNKGIVSGAIITKGRTGSIDAAFQFDGIDDFIRVPNSPSLNPTNLITVAAWYKTTPYVGGGNDGLVSKGFTSHVAPYYQYQLGVCGSNYWNGNSGFGFSVGLNDTYKAVSTGSGFYEINTWYHIVGTYDGFSLKIYVNGDLINKQDATGTMRDYGTDLYIARLGNKSEYYNTIFHMPGIVDDVRIYSRALTAEEIMNLYKEIE